MLKPFHVMWLLLTLMLMVGGAAGQTRQYLQGYCEQGGQTVTTDGRTSTTKVQRSYPSCTVTVYQAGTLTLATIASDEAGTPKANPFTADSTGSWGFWATVGRYDVRFSGAGITTPFTRPSMWIVVPGGGGGGTISGGGATPRIPYFFPDGQTLASSILEQVGVSEIRFAGGSRSNLASVSLTYEMANDTGTGTTNDRLAKLSGAPSRAIVLTTGDTNGIIGIVTANGGVTGSAKIAFSGTANCEFDGSTTAGNYVGSSTTTAGKCKDLGSSVPTTGAQIIGRVLTTNVGAGTYSVLLTGLDPQGRSSSLSGSGNAGYVTMWASANSIQTATDLFRDATTDPANPEYVFQDNIHIFTTQAISRLRIDTDQAVLSASATRATNTVMFTMKGVASQTGDFIRLTDSASTIVFRLDIDGDVRPRNVDYSWPSANASGVLTNNGSGTLTWSAAAGTITGSGSAGQVSYWTTASNISGENAHYWDATNDRLSIGIGAAPAVPLHVLADSSNTAIRVKANAAALTVDMTSDGTTGIVGTTTNHGFDLYSNSGLAIHMDGGSGRAVGIGTSSPVAQLNVVSPANATIPLIVDGTAGTTSDLLRLRKGTTTYTSVGSDGIITTGVSTLINGKLLLKNSTNSNSVTLASGVTTTSYEITFPVAAPATTNQCLEMTSGGAIVLTGSTCGSGGGSISGSGTSGNLTKFTGATSIGNALFTESGTTITLPGQLVVNQASTSTVGVIFKAVAAATAELVNIQDSGGSVRGGWSTAGAFFYRGFSSAPTVSLANDGKLYYDIAGGAITQQLLLSKNTGQYNPVVVDNTASHTNNVIKKASSTSWEITDSTMRDNGTVVQFSGTSALFPALKRSGVALQFRLADDSGFADLAVRNASVTTAITDSGGNESLIIVATGSAVNEFTITNAATGSNPKITASGSDSNVGLDFLVKGTGVYRLLASASGPTDARWFEDSDNGTNYVSLIAASSLASDFVLTLPSATDTLVGKATPDILTNKTLSTGAAVTVSVAWSDGVKQTFNPDGTNAGVNVGSQAGDPSSLANGDIWYDSTGNKFRCRQNGASVDCISSAAAAGGSNTEVQYNNGGSLGGITGFTSNGTNVTAGSGNLTATRPKFITSIDDTNGNELFKVTATGSAVNEFTVANAATGNSPTLSATGGDTDINIAITPKGIGTTILTNVVTINGYTLSTAADQEGMMLNATGSITKNNTNTRTFYGVKIEPTLVAGASNANTTFNVLYVGVSVTDSTGITTNLLKLDYAATERFSINSSGVLAFRDGVRQTFNPDGTTPGLNVGSQAGDPSTPSNGDLWYDSTANELTARINGSNVALGAGGGGTPAGTDGDFQINLSGSFAAGVINQSTTGRPTVTPLTVSSGVAKYFRIITPADTGLTADAEAIGVQIGGDTSVATVTRTLADGTTIALQRENVIVHPTYAAAGATTLSLSCTLCITGAPASGSNITQTRPLAFYIGGNAAMGMSGPAGDVYLQNVNTDLRISAPSVATGVFRLLPFGADIYFENTISGALIFRYDTAGSPKEIFRSDTNGQVGFNKSSSIAGQIHVVSGATTRVGFRVDSAANSTVDLAQLNLIADDTSTVANLATLGANSNGTAATGFGQSITFNLETSTTADQKAAGVSVLWTDATHASRTSAIVFNTTNSATDAERMRINFWGIQLTAVAFANLGTPADGTIAYCNDCTIASPCAGSGTGAIAKRLNSTWVCN